MVGGQVADMEGEGAEATLEAVEFIHTNKTARPLRAAVLVGRAGRRAPAPTTSPRSATFGEKMGLAFQIADDLLDVTGTEEEMGKAVGKDADRGKLTYPAVVGRAGPPRPGRPELTEEALAALARFGDRAWALGVDSALRGRETELTDSAGPRHGAWSRDDGQGRALGRILDNIDSPADIKGLDAGRADDARGGAQVRDHPGGLEERRASGSQPRRRRADAGPALRVRLAERQARSGTSDTRATPTSSSRADRETLRHAQAVRRDRGVPAPRGEPARRVQHRAREHVDLGGARHGVRPRPPRGRATASIAVIGDGSLTAGLAFEGLNQAGHLKKNLMVVVNDNRMSIAKNVGALSQYLTRLRSAPTYQRLESEVWDILGKVPGVGAKARELTSRALEGVRGASRSRRPVRGDWGSSTSARSTGTTSSFWSRRSRDSRSPTGRCSCT